VLQFLEVHAAHAPPLAELKLSVFLWPGELNKENFLRNFCWLQPGQVMGEFKFETSFSNWLPQTRHSYS